MPDNNVENIKTFTNKQIISILGAAIFTTFSLTTIYNKFVFNDEEIQLNKSNIKVMQERIKEIENNKASNERLDKKTKRIEDNVSTMDGEVKKLQEPNSDKQKQ